MAWLLAAKCCCLSITGEDGVLNWELSLRACSLQPLTVWLFVSPAVLDDSEQWRKLLSLL